MVERFEFLVHRSVLKVVLKKKISHFDVNIITFV